MSIGDWERRRPACNQRRQPRTIFFALNRPGDPCNGKQSRLKPLVAGEPPALPGSAFSLSFTFDGSIIAELIQQLRKMVIFFLWML
jgi:hypothetical protein